ncbi:methyltransferase domain-containing protein [Roseateles cavernae]|uniref:methyltransferase domain-containing protein n=1 Tax=Roseateles cavernae TaxID=3153578 RepID=UPI0032E3BCA6
MRDPAASLRFEDDRVIRDLKSPLGPDHFLHSDLARKWVDRGDLVQFKFESDCMVIGRRIPFVTQPAEWSDAQLHAAGALTLRLQVEAVAAGYDMKDASAWNVLFDGARPVFCDLMSFDRLLNRKWWALGQFARHFIFPLVASRRCGLSGHVVHTMWRDGMPVERARQLFGRSIFLTRYGALMLGDGRSALHSDVSSLQGGPRTSSAARVEEAQDFRRRVHASLGWMMEGLSAKAVASTGASGWSGYRGDRPHYRDASLVTKRSLVTEWMRHVRPAWVLDLGCNTGEFSIIAAENGARVVSVDADHDSIATLFQAQANQTAIHPMVSVLDDLRGGRGWAASEHPGLTERLDGRMDLVMVLALTHHLAVGAAVPLDAIARFVFSCSRDAAIVELIEAEDPQLRSLCDQRQRDPSEFTAERQRAAFLGAGFELIQEVSLDGAMRSLVLFRKLSR